MTTPPLRRSQVALWTQIGDMVDELDRDELAFLDEIIAVMLVDETTTFMEAVEFIREHCR